MSSGRPEGDRARPVALSVGVTRSSVEYQRYGLSIDERAFTKLLDFLAKVPGIAIDSHGADDEGRWWVRLSIDHRGPIAWQLVQEFGFALNGTSPLSGDLATRFKPVSTSPWSSGSLDSMSWLIECSDPAYRPGTCADRLDNLFPQPVGQIASWISR